MKAYGSYEKSSSANEKSASIVRFERDEHVAEQNDLVPGERVDVAALKPSRPASRLVTMTTLASIQFSVR